MNNSTLRVSDLKYIRNMHFSDYGLALSKFIALVPFATLFFMPVFNRLGFDVINEAPGFYLALLGVIISAKTFFSKIKLLDVIVFLLVAFFLLASPTFYPRSEAFVDENYVSFVLLTIPFYFIGRTINYEQDKRLLVIITRIGFIFILLYQYFAFKGYFAVGEDVADLGEEQMTVAYDFLFCVIYEFIYGFNNNSRIDRYISYIGIFLIFFMGARGPVVSILAFLVVYFVFFYNYKKHGHIKRVILLVLSGVLYYFLTPVLIVLNFVSSNIGLSNRVFESMLAQEMLDSNGRDDIYDDILTAISNDKTGFGYGLGADRLFTSHAYSHNFEMEILVSFGTILGGALLLLLLLLFIIAVYKTKGTPTCVFWFGMFCFAFLPLQFSGTWINSPELFLFIGYTISVIITKKRLFTINN